MKKIILNFKILLTNISRIIYSFLFINVGMLFSKFIKADALTYGELQENVRKGPTCYAAGPPEPTIQEKIIQIFQLDSKNVFLLLVPVVLIILLVIFIYIKRNEKKEEKDDNKKED